MSTVSIKIEGIDAEPWTAPSLSTGRSGGRVYPKAHKNAGLANYQNAIREAVQNSLPSGFEPWEHEIVLSFSIWRDLPEYPSATGRKSKRKKADATNMQKALEDALQGILFKNDVQVRCITTIIRAQAKDVKPCITILMFDSNVEPKDHVIEYPIDFAPPNKYGVSIDILPKEG